MPVKEYSEGSDEGLDFGVELRGFLHELGMGCSEEGEKVKVE
jgi:hypothetical protein